MTANLGETGTIILRMLEDMDMLSEMTRLAIQDGDTPAVAAGVLMIGAWGKAISEDGRAKAITDLLMYLAAFDGTPADLVVDKVNVIVEAYSRRFSVPD